MQTDDFQITGIDCAHCAHTLEQGIGKLNGITTCSVNLTSARLSVSYNRQNVDENAIIERIRALGYDIAPQDTTVDAATATRTSEARGPLATLRAFAAFLLARRSITAPLFVGMALLLVAVLLAWFGLPGYATHSLEVLALAVAGYPIARSALIALFIGRQMTIKLLMTIAAVGAVIIGETTEAATLMILYVVGEMLEGYTMQRSQHALQGLMALAPAEATLLVPCTDCAEHLGQEGYMGGPCPWCPPHEEQRPVAQVQVGQVMLVKPGERVPLDGRILRGASSISQQHITGESMPVERSAGETVYAGSINGDGALEIEVTAPASDTLLSRIASLVQQAQAQRAPIERFMDRFAAVYTPAVVAIAALVAVVPPLFFGQPFWNTATVEHGWLYRALALLVIACPCALVISTPVSIVSALSAATRSGILIKGGAVLEALRHIRVFAFDKTGTLTSGKPRVTNVQCIEGGHMADPTCNDCDTVLALAAAVESRTSHPLALAVVQAAAERQLTNRYASVADVLALPGRGVQGTVDGETIVIGSHAFFDAKYGHHPLLCDQIKAAEAGGQTALLVGNGTSGIMGYLTVADEPRPVSRQVLADLQASGIAHTAILTGDHAGAAERIARAVGASDVLAGLLPADKLTAIHDLRTRYGAVAMVGDGVNDTPALAAADIGIAMGAAGSAQALETADIALMSDDLTRLPFLLHLSRRTATIMHQNIALSLLPKFAVMIFALIGIAPLWLAVAADMGTSLLVTANGMRLMGERG